MKLSTLNNEAEIKSEPTGVDLDASERIGPGISKNLTALDALIKLIPNPSNVMTKMKELKLAISHQIKLRSDVLEDVVHKFDPTNPMDDSEILILGGAGSYSMKGLRRKAERECRELSDDLLSASPDFRTLSLHSKQTANTLDTMVAAIDELERLQKEHAPEEPMENVEPQNMKDPSLPRMSDIQAMYESLAPVLGDGAWIAISRKLRSEGLEKDIVVKAIDAAILLNAK